MGARAFITGITGQDGSYLAEYLLKCGYEVYGLIRRTSNPNTERIEHILGDIHLLHGDMLDQISLVTALKACKPDEVYNLAAQSHVGLSFTQPLATSEITAIGPLRLLEAIRQSGLAIRMYQASTSELYGNATQFPQDELTPFQPRSPYGIAKLFAHHMVKNYRESYGMFCCSGILFNHESPRRGLDFVSRKIARGVARIAYGLDEYITLGNIDSYRDWGFAGDYVRAMHLMLQTTLPSDYVIASGETHSVREFLEIAFEVASNGAADYHDHIVIDPKLYRPADVYMLHGKANQAFIDLEWTPRYSFTDLVYMMVEQEMTYAAKEGSFSQDNFSQYTHRAKSG